MNCTYCEAPTFVSGPGHSYYCPRYKCRPCWQKDRECSHAERDAERSAKKLAHAS